MNVQKAIFPGLIIGILSVIGFTSLLLTRPGSGRLVAQTGGVSEVSNQAATGSEVAESAVSAANAEPLECSIGSSYPESVRQWCNLIERYARENGVDPHLISAVMLQESAGKPDAYSKSGAVGLMQVMPRDGKAASFQCKNGPCFSDRPSMEELFDPEYNVAYASRMLSELIQKYGDVREALRAYGPMDVGYYYADLVIGTMNSKR